MASNNKAQAEKPEEKKAEDAVQAAETAAAANKTQAEKPEEKKADGPRRYAVLRGFIDKVSKDDLDPGDVVELEPARAAEINKKIPGAVAELAD